MDRPLFPILSNSTNCPEPTRTAKSPPARPRKSSKRGRQPENPQSKSSNLDDGLSVEGELSQQNRTVASVEPLRLNGNREEMVEACCGTVTEEDQEEEDTITMPDGVWADRELQQEEEVEQLEGKMPMDDLEAEIRLLSRQSSQATVHPNSDLVTLPGLPDFRGKRRRMISNESATSDWGSVSSVNRNSVYSVMSSGGTESVYEDALDGSSFHGGEDMEEIDHRHHSSHSLTPQSSSSSLSKHSRRLQPLRLRSSPSKELLPSPSFSARSFSPRRPSSPTSPHSHPPHRRTGSIPYIVAHSPQPTSPISPKYPPPASPNRASVPSSPSASFEPKSTIIPLRRYSGVPSTGLVYKHVGSTSPNSRQSWQPTSPHHYSRPSSRDGPAAGGKWHPKPLILTPARTISTPLTSTPLHGNRRISTTLSTTSSSSSHSRRPLSPFLNNIDRRRSLGYTDGGRRLSLSPNRDSTNSSFSLGASSSQISGTGRQRSVSEDTGLSSHRLPRESPDSSLADWSLEGELEDDAKSSSYAHSLTVVQESAGGATSWDLEPDARDEHGHSKDGYATSPISIDDGPVIELSMPTPPRKKFSKTGSFADQAPLPDMVPSLAYGTSPVESFSDDLSEDPTFSRPSEDELESHPLPIFHAQPERVRSYTQSSGGSVRQHHQRPSLASLATSLSSQGHRAKSSVDLRNGIAELNNPAAKRKTSLVDLIKKSTGKAMEARAPRTRIDSVDSEMLKVLSTEPVGMTLREQNHNRDSVSPVRVDSIGATPKDTKRTSVARRFIASFRPGSKLISQSSSNASKPRASASILIPPLTPTDSTISSKRFSPISSSSITSSSRQLSPNEPSFTPSESLDTFGGSSFNSGMISKFPIPHNTVVEEEPGRDDTFGRHLRTTSNDSSSSAEDTPPRLSRKPFAPPPGLGGTYQLPPALVYESTPSSTSQNHSSSRRRTRTISKDSSPLAWYPATPVESRRLPSPTTLLVAETLFRGPPSPGPPSPAPSSTSSRRGSRSNVFLSLGRRGSNSGNEQLLTSAELDPRAAESTRYASLPLHAGSNFPLHKTASEMETLRGLAADQRNVSRSPKRRPLPLDLLNPESATREEIRSQLLERSPVVIHP